MKKIFVFALVALVLSALCLPVLADEATNVYVTISDENGKPVVFYEKIAVSDIDGDGAITINDALYCAHEAKYEGGAAAGYASSNSEYGISLNKLWGTANGGAYGYYVNNQSAMSLSDTLKEGDHLQAYVYTDLVFWSDTYSFFDINAKKIDKGEEITLSLSTVGFDENWAPVSSVLSGATIIVNGKATDIVTDEEGKFTLSFEESGKYKISAEKDGVALVPPVAVITVKGESTLPAGDNSMVFIAVILALVALTFGAAIARQRR